MKKRIFTILLTALLCFALAFTVQGEDLQAEFLVDDALLLSDLEASVVSNNLESASAAHNAQVAIMTVTETDGRSVDNYIEYIYDSMGYGYGPQHDGVLLLICMDTRDYRILSNGFVADAIGPDEINAIGDAMVDDLSAGNYASAFCTFAEKCEYYINGHLNGFPFDLTKNLIIAAGVGILASMAVTAGLKGQLKTVHKKKEANAYVRAGSVQITQSNDFFLYRDITRQARQKSSSSSSSRSGSSRNVGGGKF